MDYDDISAWRPRFARWVPPFLALLMLAGGLAKFLGDEPAAQFSAWRYPAWMVYFVGVLELTSAVFLVRRTTVGRGAALAAVVAFGATFTHLRWGELDAVVSIFFLVVAMTLAWLHRDTIRPFRHAAVAARPAWPGPANTVAAGHAVREPEEPDEPEVSSTAPTEVEGEPFAAASAPTVPEPAPPPEAEPSAESLATHTVAELRALGRDRGLTGLSRLRKAELIARLLE